MKLYIKLTKIEYNNSTVICLTTYLFQINPDNTCYTMLNNFLNYLSINKKDADYQEKYSIAVNESMEKIFQYTYNNITKDNFLNIYIDNELYKIFDYNKLSNTYFNLIKKKTYSIIYMSKINLPAQLKIYNPSIEMKEFIVKDRKFY